MRCPTHLCQVAVFLEGLPEGHRTDLGNMDGGEDPRLALSPPDLSTLGRKAGMWLEALLWSGQGYLGGAWRVQ